MLTAWTCGLIMEVPQTAADWPRERDHPAQPPRSPVSKSTDERGTNYTAFRNLRVFTFVYSLRLGYADWSEAISMTKRYFTSLFSIRS